jgi:hypothetical protein
VYGVSFSKVLQINSKINRDSGKNPEAVLKIGSWRYPLCYLIEGRALASKYRKLKKTEMHATYK